MKQVYNIFVVFCLLLFLLVCIWFIVHRADIAIFFKTTFDYNSRIKDSSDLLAKFGDYFGGVFGTLFTILTSVFVILTFWQQKNQIRKTTADINYGRCLDMVLRQVELTNHQLDRIVFKSRIPGADDRWFESKSMIQFGIEANLPEYLTFPDRCYIMLRQNIDSFYHASRAINNAFAMINTVINSCGLPAAEADQIRLILRENLHAKVYGFYQVIIPQLNIHSSELIRRTTTTTWSPLIHLNTIYTADTNLFQTIHPTL